MNDRPPRRAIGWAHLAVVRDWFFGSVEGLPLVRLAVTNGEVSLTPVIPYLFRVRIATKDSVTSVSQGRLGGIRVEAPALPLGGFVFHPLSAPRRELLDDLRARGFPVVSG